MGLWFWFRLASRAPGGIRHGSGGWTLGDVGDRVWLFRWLRVWGGGRMVRDGISFSV
jgi:hypothetical protein